MSDEMQYPSRCKHSISSFFPVRLFSPKAYFRRSAEARRAEIILARFCSAWHASVLDEESIAVLKQLY